MYNYLKSNQTWEKPKGIEIDRKLHSLYLLNLNSINMDKLEYVTLNVIPENVNEQYKQRILTESLYGTYSPQYFYTGGENKTISFNIKLIEDEHNEDGSIYKLAKKIKEMGEPFYLNGLLKEPLIYFELGDQFAGKGYINSEFNFSGPYRNSRYIVVDINITITIVEQYEDMGYDLTLKELDYINTTGLTISPLDLGTSISVDDLFDFPEAGDLTLIKDFAFQKATTNIFVDNQNFKYLDVRSAEDFKKILHPVQIELQETYDFWLDYTLIVSSDMFTTNKKIENLNKLIKKVERFLEIYHNRHATIFEDYTGVNPNNTLVLIKNSLQDLIELIKAQLKLYSALGGPTL